MSASLYTSHRGAQTENNMDLAIHCFDGRIGSVEVDEDDSPMELRAKIAFSLDLREDSFHINSADGDNENINVRHLSAGDALTLKETAKYVAVSALHARGQTDLTSELLSTVRDPAVASFLLQAEVSTIIPNKFLAKSPSLQILDLSEAVGVTIIEADFLADCSGLRSINLSGLSSVVSIGSGFMENCTSIKKIDLVPFRSLESIGDSFLHGCTALMEVGLSDLNVSHIGHNFLSDCTALEMVNLSGLRRVALLKHNFLSNCSSLKAVDLSALNEVRRIWYGCLCDCSALESVDLSGFANVTQIGGRFLAECRSLKHINLSALRNVSQIEGNFLRNCKISNVVLTPLKNVSHVGHNFMENCEVRDISECNDVIARSVQRGRKSVLIRQGCEMTTHKTSASEPAHDVSRSMWSQVLEDAMLWVEQLCQE